MPSIRTGNSVMAPTYEPRRPRLAALYETGKRAQWNGGTDIDWSLGEDGQDLVPHESESVLASFHASPLARHGIALWQAFRRELQTWIVSQFLHGEQGALVAAGRLTAAIPDIEAKSVAAAQAADEARHVEVFARYIRERVPDPYPIAPSLATLLYQSLAGEWDLTALGVHVVVEPVALAEFRLAERTFSDPLVRQITELVARDESRHISFGVILLGELAPDWTNSERAQREDFVLEAASLISRQFLLEEIWDRLGIDAREGATFATTNEVMVAYRKGIFSRVISSLARIGLLTPRVRAGLARLDILSPISERALRRSP